MSKKNESRKRGTSDELTDAILKQVKESGGTKELTRAAIQYRV